MDRRKSEHAEKTALYALDWLAQTDDLLEVFLGSSGLAPDDLRARPEDPELLAAILDFVMMNDRWVVACASHADVAPQDFAAARADLPGGADPYWT